MWVLSSDQDAPCVRPLKPPGKGEDAGPEPGYNPSIWIRPGKEYTAGRSEAFDLCITHQKLSRKKLGFILRASAVDPDCTHLQHERNIHKPAYTLTIEAGEQGLLATDESGADIEIKAGCKLAIQDGMQINAFAEKKRECIMRFRWRPVHIYHRAAKKKDLPALQTAFAHLGITFTGHTTCSEPNVTHTHAVFLKFSTEPSAPQLVAANCQLLMIEPGWVDALLKAAEPFKMSSGGDEPRQVEKSKLELDFERNWPSEPRYFPSIDGREATAAEKKVWIPDPRRRMLFEDIAFIDCSVDPNVAVLVATAGGQVFTPELGDVPAFGRTVSKFCTDASIGKKRIKKYLILPHLLASLKAEEHKAFLDAKESFQLDGYIRAGSIFASIKDVSPLIDVLTEYVLPQEGQTVENIPAPTPTMPGATADLVYPATYPGDVAASAPKQSVDLKRGLQTAAGSDNRPNKKPRKLADRGIVDPLANLFSTNIGTSAPAPVGAESVKDIQVNTQASTTSIARSTTTVEQDSQSQSRFLRPDSKYSKLKRRVGQGSSSQLPGQSMLDQVEEEEAVPSKRFKSFDPNIESVTSQAAARLKEKEAKEKMAHLHSDGGEDVKAIASERRVAEIGSDSDQDSSAKATQSKSRKKAGQADNEGKPNAKQTRTDDRPSAKESVYLQIKTGRRKIGKADADINEDFNNLRIKKTQAPESHKMGWNERDVFQEEMTEDAAWEAEDKSTFFQVRFVPMARPKSSVRSQALSVDPLYTGRPNFKAFKPKALVASTSTAAGQRKKRADIALVAYEAPSYGLQESYGDRGPRQNNGDDSDTSIEMPMPDLENTRKGKGRAKATASSRATKSAKGKRAVVSDSSEEDELEGQESSTAREESAPAVKK